VSDWGRLSFGTGTFDGAGSIALATPTLNGAPSALKLVDAIPNLELAHGAINCRHFAAG
jgi:hypothetical protein